MLSRTSKSALILIGMPGAGKSTLGVLLAKTLALPFVDTDILIQQRIGITLQDYLDQFGYLALRAAEERVLMEQDFSGHVVATGGSAVYSQPAMEKLSGYGRRIYLQVSLPTLVERVTNQEERGLACEPGTSLEQLYDQRRPLYERFADVTIDTASLNFEQSLSKILDSLRCNR